MNQDTNHMQKCISPDSAHPQKQICMYVRIHMTHRIDGINRSKKTSTTDYIFTTEYLSGWLE